MNSEFCLTPRTSYEWDGIKHQSVDINSDHLEETLQYIHDENIDMISISHWYGYKLKDIDFILNIEGLKGIHIYDVRDTDVSVISKCKSLEHISLLEVNQKLDLSVLPSLRSLNLDWYPCIQLPSQESGKNLRQFGLSRFRDKTFDPIPIYENLENMKISFGSFQSLSGLERFKSLKIYEHHYGKNLVDISSVTSLSNLETLRFDHCKKIHIDDIFERCHKLRNLAYFSAPDIPSLFFLKKMKCISDFRFGDCSILDGDLTPLLDLESFAFYPNKKHYSHTEEELKKLQLSGHRVKSQNDPAETDANRE